MYTIYRKKDQKEIAAQVQLMRGFSTAFGLMLQEVRNVILDLGKEVDTPKVHTHLCFGRMDIVWLDGTKHVTYIAEGVEPYKVRQPRVKARYIVELKCPLAFGLRVGDQLEWRCVSYE